MKSHFIDSLLLNPPDSLTSPGCGTIVKPDGPENDDEPEIIGPDNATTDKDDCGSLETVESKIGKPRKIGQILHSTDIGTYTVPSCNPASDDNNNFTIENPSEPNINGAAIMKSVLNDPPDLNSSIPSSGKVEKSFPHITHISDVEVDCEPIVDVKIPTNHPTTECKPSPQNTLLSDFHCLIFHLIAPSYLLNCMKLTPKAESRFIHVPVCLIFAYGIFSALILNSNFLTHCYYNALRSRFDVKRNCAIPG